MRANTSRMWRSGIAMLLALCLVVGFFPVAAFATGSGEGSEKPLVYVSIGDSMTNGYGLDGYNGESGIMNYGINTYANKFAAWLAGYTGEIADDQFWFEGTKGVVDHRQLAMSGMRSEDLHWLLELDYDSDAPYNAVYSYIHGEDPSWGNKYATITDKPVYKKWFEWYTPKAEGGYGFTAGDYRTYADLVDPSYRLGDGVAKLMSLYGYNSDKYFNSDYDTEAMVNAAVAGLNSDEYYPEEDTDKNGVVMGYSESEKTALWMQIAGEFYQESVADADIITLALGNTNFGTFLFQYIRWSFENDAYEFDNRYNIEDAYKLLADFNPKLEAPIRNLMDNEVNDIINQFFSVEALGGDENAERCATEINYIIKYCVLSYLVNYIGAVERILELNPDVTLIQLALMNAYATAETGSEQEIEGTNFADLIDFLYTPVNAFLAALPTYMQLNENPVYEDATFLWADAGLVETLSETFGDNFYTKNGAAIEYPGLELTDDIAPADSLVRKRFRHWIAGDYGEEKSKVYYSSKPSYGEIWKGLLHNYVDTSKEGDFFGTYDLMYVTDGDLVAYVNMSNADFEAKLTGHDKTERDWAFSILMYLAFEDALIGAGQGSLAVESLSKLSGIGPAQFEDAINTFCEKLGVDSMTSAPTGGIDTIDVMKFPQYLSETLQADPTAASLLALCSRMQVGTGIGGHPSEGGHYTMYQAIKNAYETGYTAADETKNVLWGYLSTQYPNLAEAIGAAQGFTGNVDDLAIIMAALKMKQPGNPALAGVDLDAVEARIRDLSRQFDEDLAYEDQVFLLESGNVLMAYLENIASEATAIKYEPTEDSFYVSLGDSNVNGYGLDGYVDNMQNGLGQVVEGSAPVQLAKKLYGDDWKDHFGQYAQGALRSEDLLYILGVEEGIVLDAYYNTEIAPNLMKGNIEDTRAAYIEAIEKADLISVAIGGGNVTTFVGRQMDLVAANQPLVEMDWSKIGVENEALTELNDLLDQMVPLMDELGLMDKYVPEGITIENPAKFARALAESMLYGYASYNFYYTKVLDRIHEINPDARLLILGMFNPVDDWTMEMDGQIVPIGGAINNVMMAANLENLAYALQHDNTSYVDLSDNITFLDAKIANGFEPTFADYYKEILEGNGKEVHANQDGHDYMTAQMYAVLEEEFEDKKEENLKEAFDAFAPIIKEAILRYGPDVAEEVWKQWNEYGYVAMVEETIDELKDVIKIRYDLTVKETLPAINTAIDALSAEKDLLVAELDELYAQLAAKKAELEAVINGIEIGSVHVPEINIDAIGGNVQTEVPAYDCEVEGEGVVAELEAAIRDIEHAIAVIEALITDVDADLADMVKLAEQIADAVKELNKTYNDITAAAEDVYDAFKAIEKVLTGDADKTIDAVAEAYEAACKTAMAAIDVLEIAMDAAHEIDGDILKMVDIIVEDAEALYEKFITELPGCIDKIPPEIMFGSAFLLNEAITMAKEELPGKIEELKAETRKEIEALIEEYKPQIEQAEKDLEAKWESEIQPQIEEKYAELKAQIEAEYNAKVAELEAKRAELIAELISAKEELKTTAENAVAPLLAQIERLEKDIATVTADLAHAAGHLETALKLAYEEAKIAVMALYNEAMAQLNAAIEALKAQLEQAIEDLKNALKNMIEDALGELLDEVKKTVEELKNSLIAMGIETVEELVDALVALFNELLYQATHADLVIDEDFKYVALGDGSAAADGYAEALNAYLAAEAAENGINSIEFVNEAEVGNSVAAEAADLSAEVADADLITLGFSQTDMLANAITAGELDWAALLGAEAVPYIEEAMAKVAAEIDALELPEEMKELLKATVEAYAYNVVEYTIELPALLQAIREVNEDAVVIVVGMYNPIDDITAFGYDLSAVGEYFDYLIEAADAYGIGLAMLTGELDYVVADEVEIAQSKLSLGDLGDLLEGDLSVMYPSANGDAYIAERIENALTLSFEVGGLWGDADGDGIVTPIDAMLVLQYYVGDITAAELNVNVCDVDDDGAVSPIDAMLILQYYVGDIAKFPVEG